MSGLQKYTKPEFIKMIRDKHPEYSDIPDEVFLQKYLAKYPHYREQIVDHTLSNDIKRQMQHETTQPFLFQNSTSKALDIDSKAAANRRNIAQANLEIATIYGRTLEQEHHNAHAGEKAEQIHTVERAERWNKLTVTEKASQLGVGVPTYEAFVLKDLELQHRMKEERQKHELLLEQKREAHRLEVDMKAYDQTRALEAQINKENLSFTRLMEVQRRIGEVLDEMDKIEASSQSARSKQRQLADSQRILGVLESEYNVGIERLSLGGSK